ncbi:MAG: amidohydrolase [Planctomycetes bacterium]|nr:amidohydrolase [Planctomycetota bacterium]
MAKAVDFHTHAFPDGLAAKAIATLEAQPGNPKAVLDGTLGGLLRSMDAAGIETSVVACIATKPEQFPSILNWCRSIASERIVPFPSFHPFDPAALARIDAVREAGLKGIKLHPYYQGFDMDDPRLLPIYEALQESGLLHLSHTGFDTAFPRIRKCDAVRVLRLLDRFPRLRLVTTHLGGWQDWGETRRHLLGRPIYMEISYSLEFMDDAAARELLLGHPKEYLLFGTDSPWSDQKRTVERVLSLGLGAEREAALLHDNARRLLGRTTT